jgi:hypothetical protein
MDLTYAYTSTKPPLPEPVESLRERIPGWGVDLDPADRPAVPRETTEERPEGATWDLPERQPARGYRERSIEHADLTPVFGTAQPLRGVPGAIRRVAYERFSEARTAHWLILMGADRTEVLLSTLRSFASTRPDNPVTQTGIRAELTHHGLRSRLGRRRADLVHHPLDPLIVLGPWLLGAEATRRTVRLIRKRFTPST